MSSPDPGIALQQLPRLHGPDGEISPDTLQQSISELSRRFTAQGLQPQRLALLLGNTPQFAATLLSVFLRKGSAVLLNPALTSAEIAKALHVAGAGYLVTPVSFSADDALPISKPQDIVLPGLGAMRMWQVGDGAQQSPPDDEFVVQFTSGVSGAPLAVSRTYTQVTDEVTRFCERITLAHDDVVLGAAPLFHSYGLFAGLMSSFHAHAGFVIVPNFTPADIAAIVQKYRPTVFLGVPVMYEALLRTPSARSIDFSSFRLLLSAGAPLLGHVTQDFRERFGREITQLYGTTEAGVIALNFGDGEPGSPAAVGRPLAGRHIRIVDANGSDVAAGEEGEVVLSSRAAAKAYLGRPDISAEKFRDGWYFTGDIGRRDATGCLYLTGRKSSFINVGGVKVDPSEVEQVILASGQALECAVVGVSRPQFGEIVCAHVVLKPGGTLDQVRAHCRGQLASFKMPREFHSVAALPRSATGKVLRKYLIE